MSLIKKEPEMKDKKLDKIIRTILWILGIAAIVLLLWEIIKTFI
jgi:hypothetical protein